MTLNSNNFSILSLSLPVANCIGWVCYGLLLKDNWIFWGNLPGVLIGLWCCFGAIELCGVGGHDAVIRQRISNQVIGIALLWALVGYVGIFIKSDFQFFRLLLGGTTTAILCLMYAAPLSTLASVIRNWDSSSLYPPLSVIYLFNGSMWAVYGLLAMNDPFIYGPNLVGAVLGAVQVSLVIVLPRRLLNDDIAKTSPEKSEPTHVITQTASPLTNAML